MATHDTHKPAATATKSPSPVQRAPEQAAAEPETERTEQVAAPQFTSRLHGQQQARMMQRMQRTVGNAQVQRMLKAAPVQQSPAIKATETASPSPIVPAQRTAVPVAEVQRTPEPAVTIPSSAPVQRTPAPIMRGWQDWNPINMGKRALNTLGNAAQQGAKWVFEKALKTAGVNPGRVMGLINRAGGAIGSIISNPGRFANTLVSAVKQGFGKFQGNIGTHLQSGFSGWLFGTMSGAGVAIPKDLSAPSVLSLVLQVLNITPAALKQRVGRQIGEKNVDRMEQAWNVIGTAMRSGPGGLWTMLKEQLGDLQAVVIGGIKEWVISSVVKSAVLKIISMFNPASGIVAAIKLIYDVVSFLIERASQIGALFQAVGDSAGALAQGNVQQAAAKIEQVLARMIPVAIGFLASMVGLKGVAQKVKEIIGKVRSRIDAAIDKMITKVVSRFKGIAQKADEKPGSGIATSRTNPAERDRQLQAGLAAIHSQEQKLTSEGGISHKEAKSIASKVKKDHTIFQSLSVVDGGKTWNYGYTINRIQVEEGHQTKEEEEIIKIDSLGNRMKFRQSVRNEMPVRDNNPKDKPDIKTKYIEHRRHVVAYEALELGILHDINGKTAREAAEALQKLGAKVTKFNQKGVITAARRLLRELHNDKDNLWVGPVSENSYKGGKYTALKNEIDLAMVSGNKVQFQNAVVKMRRYLVDVDPRDHRRLKFMDYVNKAIVTFFKQFKQLHADQ